MGRKAILDNKLVAKIAKKLKKPEINIVKSVCAMANRRTISSEAALIMFAQKHNIGTAIARSKLSAEKQAQIRPATPSNTTMPTPNRRAKLITKTIEDDIDYLDPFLTTSVYSDPLTVSVEAYQILYILENSLRSFIERVLSGKHGNDWWKKVEETKSTAEIAKEVARRKSTEAGNWHHAKRGVHEIYYADYPHLLQFMRSFEQEFSPFFKKIPEKNLPGKLAELTPTRNIVAHNNPITKNDLNRLQVHSKDWIKYMQHLNSQKKS